MRSLRKFLALSGSQQWLLVQAFVRLLGVSVRLRLHSPAWLKASLQPGDTAAAPHAAGHDPRRIVWAVDIAGRYVPGCTCLVSAITAQRMLARQGCPAAVRLGVSRDAGSLLKAHAWLESEGRVLMGGATQEQYQPLSPAPQK